ncbi:type II secretion system minor pseudopilin GspK [Luminiphilus sp.]|nr:type II secretion system minor pseudopilin GspK [Luminiphilus sp.]MDA8986041.1 type II secretion system minor pseudopilin GspK [Luminiphilus sp.]
MCCLRPEPYRSQRGAALIIAMLVFALSATLLVALQREFSLALQRGTHQLFSEQAWAYLIGAEELAKLALQTDTLLDARSATAADHLGELWAQPATPYPLAAGGWMTGQLTDLQGRINLNMLVKASGNQNQLTTNERPIADDTGEASAGDTRTQPSQGDNQSGREDEPVGQSAIGEADRWTATQKLLIRLLQALGDVSLPLDEAMTLTEAISDFIDRDANRRQNGAEVDEYRYTDFPYLPANRALASVSELRSVRGMTPEVYEALAPLVTVWPERNTQLNILTAPLPVLRALNADDQWAPLSVMDAERLAERRQEGGITEVRDLLTDPILEGRPSAELEPLLDIRSDWFLLDASVELVDRQRHLFTVLRRGTDTTVAVFRSEGEL